MKPNKPQKHAVKAENPFNSLGQIEHYPISY